jgi:hypothetical protein
VTGLVPLLGLVMAVGAVGTIVPLVPGISLVWGAGLVYGLDRGFGTIGVVAFAVMTGLAVAATSPSMGPLDRDNLPRSRGHHRRPTQVHHWDDDQPASTVTTSNYAVAWRSWSSRSAPWTGTNAEVASMPVNMTSSVTRDGYSQPLLHQHGEEIQTFGSVRQFPIALS